MGSSKEGSDINFSGVVVRCCAAGVKEGERSVLQELHNFPTTFLQGIADYIARCKQAIGKFESLVHQIHKNADDISSRIMLIESVNLFKYPSPKNEEELPGMACRCFLFTTMIIHRYVCGTHTCAHIHVLSAHVHVYTCKWNSQMCKQH